MDTRDAIRRARNEGMDLVEISPNSKPPVCRIMDYGKFLYQQKKRSQELKKTQTEVVVKELKFRPATDDHDYSYRMERAKEWIAKGYKVRATITFRGREMTHREFGFALLSRLKEDLAEIAEQEIAPKMEGNRMFAFFVKK